MIKSIEQNKSYLNVPSSLKVQSHIDRRKASSFIKNMQFSSPDHSPRKRIFTDNIIEGMMFKRLDTISDSEHDSPKDEGAKSVVNLDSNIEPRSADISQIDSKLAKESFKRWFKPDGPKLAKMNSTNIIPVLQFGGETPADIYSNDHKKDGSSTTKVHLLTKSRSLMNLGMVKGLKPIFKQNRSTSDVKDDSCLNHNLSPNYVSLSFHHIMTM